MKKKIEQIEKRYLKAIYEGASDRAHVIGVEIDKPDEMKGFAPGEEVRFS